MSKNGKSNDEEGVREDVEIDPEMEEPEDEGSKEEKKGSGSGKGTRIAIVAVIAVVTILLVVLSFVLWKRSHSMNASPHYGMYPRQPQFVGGINGGLSPSRSMSARPMTAPHPLMPPSGQIAPSSMPVVPANSHPLAPNGMMAMAPNPGQNLQEPSGIHPSAVPVPKTDSNESAEIEKAKAASLALSSKMDAMSASLTTNLSGISDRISDLEHNVSEERKEIRRIKAIEKVLLKKIKASRVVKPKKIAPVMSSTISGDDAGIYSLVGVVGDSAWFKRPDGMMIEIKKGMPFGGATVLSVRSDGVVLSNGMIIRKNGASGQ